MRGVDWMGVAARVRSLGVWLRGVWLRRCGLEGCGCGGRGWEGCLLTLGKRENVLSGLEG